MIYCLYYIDHQYYIDCIILHTISFLNNLLSKMTFNEFSAGTTRGDQVHHHTLLNSKISKEIHDQGETLFCWAFAISSMLRQSLKRYFNTLDLTNPDILNALSKLDKNEFHKRLRNELTMIPIPKAKRVLDNTQAHVVDSAIDRVSLNIE